MRAAAIATIGAGAMLAVGLQACGSDDGAATRTSAGAGSAKRVRIYSSQPLQGATRGQAQAVINGEKLALRDAGGKGGKCPVDYVPLDDSTAAAAQWDPGAVSANARKALADKETIAYLGEFNSGASAVSLPILNEAPILQVSPS